MLRIVQTFNSHNINDGSNYQAVILNPYTNPAAQPVFVAQANADSEDAGVYTVDVNTVAISIRIKNYSNRQALISQLQKWFKRGTLADLVVTFTDDSLDYFKPCRVINLVQDPEHPMYFIVTLNTGWTEWRAVIADTFTWNLSGTSDTESITLLGDGVTPLSATFTISSPPANGYIYQRFYQLPNMPQTTPALGWGPWCITIDTAALIADNANKVQINQGGGINNSVTTIPYDTVTGVIPTAGTGYVDSEQIRWTGKNATQLTGVTRGIGGTTAASHADDAEIKLSYILANGNDLRVFINEREVNRWPANMNNASTKIWVNVAINTGYNLALKTAIASSGSISHIEFAVTPNVLSALTAMPQEGILVHGSEWIKYRGKDLTNYRLVVVQRGVMNTTLQAHSAGDVFAYMEHVIKLCYGNVNAVDPASVDATYNNTKPCFELSASTNASWVYDATSVFEDTRGTGRTGGWRRFLLRRLGGLSLTYEVKEIQRTGDPALGMVIGSFPRYGGWASEDAGLGWEFYRACGIDTSTFTGRKYRTGASFPTKAALQNSANGATWFELWNESTPGSPTTWTALGSHSGVDMSDLRWMRTLFDGTIAAGGNAYAAFELLTGTIAFVSANLPTGTLLAQQLSAHLELTLSNADTGDVIGLTMPMLPGLPLALDGEARTVLYHETNAHDVLVMDDESRAYWIPLQPGDNDLTISSVALGTLAVDLSWYRRRF